MNRSYINCLSKEEQKSWTPTWETLAGVQIRRAEWRNPENSREEHAHAENEKENAFGGNGIPDLSNLPIKPPEENESANSDS